jgi:hypothetical protein
MILAQRDGMDMSNSVSSSEGSRSNQSSLALDNSGRPSSRHGFESQIGVTRQSFVSQIEVHSQVEIQPIKNLKAHPQHHDHHEHDGEGTRSVPEDKVFNTEENSPLSSKKVPE